MVGSAWRGAVGRVRHDAVARRPGRSAATRAGRTPDAVDTAPRRPVDPASRHPGALRPRRPADGTAVPRPAQGRLHRLRVATAVASALVFVLTGVAWGLYRDVTAGITTTDVIAGGGDGGPLDILLVGVDSRTDTKGNPLPQEVLEQLHTGGDNPRVLNSDTIILLHVPEDGGAAVAFSIPRDAYVDIPGFRTDKINAAYPAVSALTAERLIGEGVRDRAWIDAESARAGRVALIGAVEQLTGVTVDHFAEVNLLGFYDLTRAIGGVDVCLKAPVDVVLSGARFPAGPRTFRADALAFVRQRHGLPEGDLSRIRRQQVFLAAVAAKILSGGTLTDPAKLGGLIKVVHQSVVLDQGWDLLAFRPAGVRHRCGEHRVRHRADAGHRDQRPGQRGAGRPGSGARVRRAAQRRAGAGRAEGTRGRRDTRADDVRAPAAAGHRGRPLRRARAQRLGHERARRSGSAAAHRARLRPRHGGQHRRHPDLSGPPPRDSPDAADAVAAQLGGFEVEQDDTVASGHLQVVLGADAPTLVPGLPHPGPATDDDHRGDGRTADHRSGRTVRRLSLIFNLSSPWVSARLPA